MGRNNCTWSKQNPPLTFSINSRIKILPAYTTYKVAANVINKYSERRNPIVSKVFFP